MKRILALVASVIFFNFAFCQMIPSVQNAKKFVVAQKESKTPNCAFEFVPWQAVESQNCILNNEKFTKNKATTRLYAFFPDTILYNSYFIDNTLLVSANLLKYQDAQKFLHQQNGEKYPAVIICPGGSYHHLGMDHEGYQVAQWFAEKGIAAFVLRYRVASHGAHHPDMIQDLQLSIALLKQYSDVWLIDTTKIGAIGFSAGGHLVLHGGIAQENFIKQDLPISDNYGLRPNYVMAIYPVVSMEDSIAHVKSRKNLLTKNYTKNDIHKYSIEQNIPDNMPPTFVLACKDDDVVDFRNSEVLNNALFSKNINNCIFVQRTTGGHGFGMSPKVQPDAVSNLQWNLENWLKEIHVISSDNEQAEAYLMSADE